MDSDRASEFQHKVKEIEKEMGKDLGNFSLHCKLAELYHEQGLHAEALEICFSLISLERSFKGYGQKTAIKILNDIGPSHVVTKPARKRLQQLYTKFHS